MNKKLQIIDTFEELGLAYHGNTSFLKKGKKLIRFDFYVPKPHKLVINISPDFDSEFVSNCGFTVLDFYGIEGDVSLLIENSLSGEEEKESKGKKKNNPAPKPVVEHKGKFQTDIVKPGKESSYVAPF